MDPMTSISLVCNIIQFVDFGSKLVHGVCELYASTDGVLKENLELEVMTRDLQSVVEPLTKHGATDPNFGAVDGEARRLVALAVSCEEISNELLALLQDLKIPNQTAYKHWHAIRQTWRNTTKSKKIKNIEDRLDRVRTQLNTRLVCLTHDSTSGMLSAFDNLTKMNSQIEANTTSKLNAMKSELIASVDDHMKNSTAIDHALIQSKLNAFMQEASVSGKSEAILKSLRYSEFKKRYFDVKPAHARTFQWIFEDSDIGFTDWLNSHSGLFWVCGKAGSGKSTLMRYILRHDTTTDLLQSWAKDKKLIIASHFFWVSGTEPQRSQEGLLKSLLFQILKQHCDLIPEVCESQWEGAVPEFVDPWSIEKLSDSLARITKNHENIRICVFIDGLDEYEGEKSELIEIINTIAASPHIKLCVSSRPWNAFRAAYKENQKIHVEQLTENDIRLYVEDNLHKSPEMGKTFNDNTESEALITKIVKKVCGVLLWVYLVMRSIVRGPDDGADLRDLQMMVDDYPEDLVKLFDRMFHSIEKRYHRETARIFRTCLEAFRPPSVATFGFLELEDDDPDYALNAEIRPLSDNATLGMNERMTKRLNARCKDFLEINTMEYHFRPSFLKYQVVFLHRTVRDYLNDAEMQSFLEQKLGRTFNAHRSLCKAALASAKALPSSEGFKPIVDPTQFIMGQMIRHARHIEVHNRESMTQELDEADRVFSEYAEFDMKGVHWSTFMNRGHDVNRPEPSTYISLAARYHLCIYVAEKLKSCPGLVSQSKDLPLLDDALKKIETISYRASDVEMVETLLRLGADPNQSVRIDRGREFLKYYCCGPKFDGKGSFGRRLSVWCHFLLRCYHLQTIEGGEKPRLEDIFEELLNYKADPFAKCHYYDENHEILEVHTAEDIIKAVFSSDHRLCRLLQKKKEEAAHGPAIWSLLKGAFRG